MTLNKALLQNKKNDWETPDDLVDFSKFDIDAAANEVNHKCARWFGPGGEREDALSPEPWSETPCLIWLNPPYNRQREFVTRALAEAKKGKHEIYMLLPARTDTKLFHGLIDQPGIEIAFKKGRLTFKGAPHPAPFPSMMVHVEGWKME